MGQEPAPMVGWAPRPLPDRALRGAVRASRPPRLERRPPVWRAIGAARLSGRRFSRDAPGHGDGGAARIRVRAQPRLVATPNRTAHLPTAGASSAGERDPVAVPVRPLHDPWPTLRW